MAKKRITRVYTKTGDTGETSLIDGKRVGKSSVRVCAYGDVDELNSVLGIANSLLKDEELSIVVKNIQNELFVLGSDLATPQDVKFEIRRVDSEMVSKIEKLIDGFYSEVGDLKEFILPGGSVEASVLHQARAVCRRAERTVTDLSKNEKLNNRVLIYLNRLSDLLFVLARVANSRNQINENYVDFKK